MKLLRLKRIVLAFMFSFFILGLTAQLSEDEHKASISFVPVFFNSPMELDVKYLFLKDSIELKTLKFYVSNISLLKDSKEVYSFPQKHILIDLENKSTLTILLDLEAEISFNKIQFDLGVDSITNVSGAFGGDLDPTKGMYWTWQSGYINFKMEGNTNLCPARNNFFQFHIGGYQHPYKSLQHVELEVGSKKEINIKLDLGQVLTQVDIADNYVVMSPGLKALDLAQRLSSLFYIQK